MLADEAGIISDTYTYDAFGNLIDITGSTENSFLYTGEQFDFNTGFYYLRARYMNPNTGTFITMDPYQGSLFDPVSLHKYLYANANPIMYSDPTGYFSLGEMSAAMSIQMTLDNMYDLHLSGMISGLTSMIYTVLKGGGADDIVESYMKGYAASMVYAGLGKLAMVSKSVRLVMAIASLGAIGMGYYRAWKDYKAGDKEAAAYLAVLSSIGAVGWAREYGGDVVDFVGSRVEAAGIEGAGNIDINIKPNVSNQKLQNIVDDLYKGQGGKNTIGNGTTMDAVRNEIKTGLPTNGKFHSIKAQETINRLQRRLRAGDLTPAETNIANELIKDLQNALGGK